MKRIFAFALFSVLIASPIALARAQLSDRLQIGGIVSTTYTKLDGSSSSHTQTYRDLTFAAKLALLMNVDVDERLSLFATMETWRGVTPYLYALGAQWQPGGSKMLQVRAGKFLAPFGNFMARRYDSVNPLIGLPLMYQYLHDLSAFDVPGDNTALLRSRGTGYRLAYNGSSYTQDSPSGQSWYLPKSGTGMQPLAIVLYLTGVELFGEGGKWRYALAVTNGSLSNPADISYNESPNLVGRVAFTPVVGLLVGASFSRGSYLNEDAVTRTLSAMGKNANHYRQTAAGADASYSYAHLELWTEYLWERYDSPFLAESLDLQSWSAEAKYKIHPRLYLTGRYSGIVFGKIADPQDTDGDGRWREPWDFAVSRLEVGLGFRLHRNGFAKISHQFNKTSDAPYGDPADDISAAQLAIFF